MSKKIAGIILLCFGFFFQLVAQTPLPDVQTSGSVRAIIEQESNIMYEIPDDILNNLETNPSILKRPAIVVNEGDEEKGENGANAGAKKPGGVNAGTQKGPKTGINKLSGFRIQVFSDGRNPATLQARARARGNAIVARFPKYKGQVYSFSSSPNWYTRIGNFQTAQEASAALAELKRAFPNFAAEMRVVKSPIVIIKK